MKKIDKEILEYFGLEGLTNSTKEEIENFQINLRKFKDIFLSRYSKESKDYLVFCFKSKVWEKESLLEMTLSNLSKLESVENKNEKVHKLIQKCAVRDKSWKSDVFCSYLTLKEKIEKLLDGLDFNEDLLLGGPFVSWLNEKGIENYRKYYGNLPKSSLALRLLNLTDDIDFLKRLPEFGKTALYKDIIRYCTLEDLKSLKTGSLKDDYYFSYLIGHYNYKEWEDELIHFDRKNKDFLKRFRPSYGNRNIEAYLRALKFLKEHEELLEAEVIYNDKMSTHQHAFIIPFISDCFILGRDEDYVLKVLKKAIKNNYCIDFVYGGMAYCDPSRAYLGDIILMLDSEANEAKLNALCILAGHLGLNHKKFKEMLKNEYSTGQVRRIYEDISISREEETFKETFGMTIEEFSVKSLTGVTPRKGEEGRIEYLKNLGFNSIDVYQNLKSIDNIIYLLNHGCEIESEYLVFVRPFFDKKDLDNIIWKAIDFSETSILESALLFNYKEVIEKGRRF